MKITVIACFTLMCLTGCVYQSRPQPRLEYNKGFIQKMQDNFKKMNDPRAAVGKVREYAIEKLRGLTDSEYQRLTRSNPVIGSNYDKTEYSFTWHGDEGENAIEVVTTPPPCEPFAVFRVSRVYYP